MERLLGGDGVNHRKGAASLRSNRAHTAHRKATVRHLALLKATLLRRKATVRHQGTVRRLALLKATQLRRKATVRHLRHLARLKATLVRRKATVRQLARRRANRTRTP